jgi:putative membrane protein
MFTLFIFYPTINFKLTFAVSATKKPMHFIINLLINALIVFAIAYIMPQITIRNYGVAILVAFLIGLLNATVGFLIRLPLNLVTLGLLTFIVRLFVTAIVIKIVDKFVSGFEVKGFTPAIVMAILLALASALVDYIF